MAQQYKFKYNTFCFIYKNDAWYLVIHYVGVRDDHRPRTLIGERSSSIQHLISTDTDRPPVTVFTQATLSTGILLQSRQSFWRQIIRCADRYSSLQVNTWTSSHSCHQSSAAKDNVEKMVLKHLCHITHKLTLS